MRVLGGRDYYDGVMAYGHDDGILFVREEGRTEQADFLPLPSWDCIIDEISYFNSRDDMSLVVVYFCGRMYVAFRVGGRVCWGIGQLEEHLDARKRGARAAFSAFFDRWQRFDGHAELLLGRGVIVAVCDDGKRSPRSRRWKVNGPDLQGCQFYRMMDPSTAFQEISLWVGNVPPVDRRGTVIMGDDVRMEKRGFDSRTSFRRGATKRRGG